MPLLDCIHCLDEPVLLSPCKGCVPTTSPFLLRTASPKSAGRLLLSQCKMNSFFMPGLSLTAMLSLAAVLTFATFVIVQHLSSAINVHSSLQTRIHHSCSREGPYQFKKGCSTRTAKARLMSYSGMIGEKPEARGPGWFYWSSRAQTNATLTYYHQEKKLSIGGLPYFPWLYQVMLKSCDPPWGNPQGRESTRSQSVLNFFVFAIISV